MGAASQPTRWRRATRSSCVSKVAAPRDAAGRILRIFRRRPASIVGTRVSGAWRRRPGHAAPRPGAGRGGPHRRRSAPDGAGPRADEPPRSPPRTSATSAADPPARPTRAARPRPPRRTPPRRASPRPTTGNERAPPLRAPDERERRAVARAYALGAFFDFSIIICLTIFCSSMRKARTTRWRTQPAHREPPYARDTVRSRLCVFL